MNKYFCCLLKNRTLLRVWGMDAFRFLQSLTTNDINKIIIENEFLSSKNYPTQPIMDKIMLTNFVSDESTSSYANENENRLVKGLPTLFLLNNGKVLFDCFIYNIIYRQKKQKFSFFFIDCYKKNLHSLLNMLNKRKLSCDVSFQHVENVAIYQALPCISVLHNWVQNPLKRKNDISNFLKYLNKKGIFFFSKDERNELLGYRIYEMNHKQDKSKTKEIKEPTEVKINMTIMEDQMEKNIVKNLIEKVKNQNKGNMFEDTVLYEFFKLHLGIVENLYSNNFFFMNNINRKLEKEKSDICKTEIEKEHGSYGYGSSSSSSNSKNKNNNDDGNNDDGSNEQKNKLRNKLSIRNLRFAFQDLTPYDLNYHQLNYLVINKGCYVGQETVNRIRNKILKNKYELCLFVNLSYYNVFLNILNKKETTDLKLWEKTIYSDSVYSNFLKEFNYRDPSLLISSFLLLKNLLVNPQNIITYKHEYNVYNVSKSNSQNNVNETIEKQNKSESGNSDTIIGYVFFYNYVMGLTFLIKNKITSIKEHLFSEPYHVYIKKEGNENDQRHNVMLISLKHNV